MAAIKALEQWCKIHCEGYRDVSITNMTTSFRSGLAFCALIHKYRPDLIDYESLRKEDVFENNRLAFQVAEEKLGIPALLDAEDMVALRIPDRLSILTYVSQYYNYFKGRPPMGGVKRPAEGSREEPSEKKNLPVVAKTFVSKSAIENRSPSALSAQTSPDSTRAAAQKAVLAENANKSGTLNSKCVACKSHVHLVQRHFVEGRLYHRSCFKCSECSSVLHAGGFKPGKTPDTFICNAHHNSCRASSSEPAIKNGPAGSAGRLNGASRPQPAPRPSSVLSAPLNIAVKPVSPVPPSKSWTASAQKTQSARQRFFQAPVNEASTGNRKSTEVLSVLGRPKVPASPENEKSRAKTNTGKKLAEENCNNNNKRPFTIRPAERRFGDEPSSADSPGLRKDKHSQGPAGNWAGRPSTSQTNNKESPCLKAVSEDNTRPTSVHTTARDPAYEWQPQLKPLKTELALKGAEAEAFTERHKPAFVSTTSSNVSTMSTTSSNVSTMSTTSSNVSTMSTTSSNFSTMSMTSSNVSTMSTTSSNVSTMSMTSSNVSTMSTTSSNVSTMSMTSSNFSTMSTTSSNVSMMSTISSNPSISTTTRPPSALTPAGPPVSFALFDPANLREVCPQKAHHRSGSKGFNHGSRSSVKSPPRRPAVESISSSTTAAANHGNPSGAKKGKYLSPTNASRTEMRSPSVKSYHLPAEQIERELNDIETNLAQLEKEGVELEKKLRGCEEEGDGDVLMDPLMVDWFNLIRKKQMYVRKESELVYIARIQELEQQQPGVEGELRRLLEKPDHLKSREERQQEKKLLQRLMEIVEGRNAIVEGLDEDRRREVEEDQQLNEMMKNLGVKKAKSKRKSSISKLFRRRSKRRVE
ncbi:MICAL-like protein 2a [Symphorus nematophorus]